MRISLLRVIAIVCFGIVSIDRKTDSLNLYPSSILGSIRNATSDATNFLSDSLQKQREIILRAKNSAADYVSNAVAVPRNMLYNASHATKDYINDATSRGMEAKFRTIAEMFRHEMPYGIPSLDIPSLDPLIIENMKYELRNKNIGNLSIVADNVTISGLKGFLINGVKISFFEGLNIALNLSVPIISALGSYQVNGTVGSMFPVDGRGPFNVDVSGSNCRVLISLGYSSAMYVKNLNIDLSIVSMDGKFVHLYNDNKVDETMNKVIFNIGPEIVDTVKPELIPQIERLLAQKINSSLAGLTMTSVIGMLTRDVYFPNFVKLSDRMLKSLSFG